MKVTNFGPGSLPLATSGWSSGTTSVNSNFNTTDGGLSALNFVQAVTVDGVGPLLRPIVNVAAGSNITLTIDKGPGNSTPSNTVRIHSTGGSGLTDPMTTRGDIIVRDSSNTTARLGIGGNNTVLSSNGTDVSWAAAAGGSGALVFLESHTASASSSLDFTTAISATYDTYFITGTILVLATNTADLRLECGTGGGPTYDTGNHYEWIGDGHNLGGSSYLDNASTGIGRIYKSVSNNGGFGNSFAIYLYGPAQTTARPTFNGNIQFVDSGPNSISANWSMQFTSGVAVTALRFIPSSGNITSGVIRMYGVKTS